MEQQDQCQVACQPMSVPVPPVGLPCAEPTGVGLWRPPPHDEQTDAVCCRTQVVCKELQTHSASPFSPMPQHGIITKTSKCKVCVNVFCLLYFLAP